MATKNDSFADEVQYKRNLYRYCMRLFCVSTVEFTFVVLITATSTRDQK